ncbi:PTS cellobiose transporter subunit IIC [Erysipelothrix sp. HDW6C]|uniref:PTS cellobiose transporter subunit IIC n=1 Tax=Erysipelothrix sp. HDW6C TaxID=2714930 RepID=UPI00140BB7CA|nr:PTS cellobiose transporter subunit IIC [Erysipelothrix sp. HDW6C]QIK69408.1 PTS cellobiose transporter subunit IIC [Erysipelothrix sp. HDW6C]
MGNKISKFMNEKVLPLGMKIGGQRHLLAIRDGMAASIPLIIVGSIFLIIGNLPIPGYTEFVAGIFGADWTVKLDYAVNATFSIMALICVFAISNSLANKYSVDGVSAGFISLAAFLVVTPLTADGGIPLAYMGSKGLFVAIVVSLVSTEIFRFMVQKDIVIKMPENVPPAVSKSFVALIPSILTVTLFWVIRLIVEATGFGNIHEIIAVILGGPLSYLGGGYVGGLVAILITSLFWTVGIHGWDLVLSVMQPTYMLMLDQNRVAFQAGAEIPNIINYSFYNVFVWMGGSGVLIAIAVLLILRSRSRQMKELAKIAVPPTVFGVNEPLMFGFPIVMNPIMIIPYVLAPVVVFTISYAAMYFKIVPMTNGVMVPWTMPPLIGGYLATGSIKGTLLQLVNIIISVAIYYPFFKIADDTAYAIENKKTSAIDA